MKAWLKAWGITFLIVLFFVTFAAGYFFGSWEQSFKAPAQQYCYRVNNMNNGITTSVTERCVPITEQAAR